MNRKIEAVIFDADGTLLDTRELMRQAFHHVLSGYGYPTPEMNELEQHFTKPIEDQYAFFAPAHDAKTLVAEHRAFQLRRKELMGIYEGLHALMQSLHDAGLKIGICTSRSATIIPLLGHADVKKYCHAIVHSEMVQNLKPDPEALHKVLEELHVDALHAVMVGDSDVDILAGKAARVHLTVGITHGFGTREALETAGADYIVDHLNDLVPLLTE